MTEKNKNLRTHIMGFINSYSMIFFSNSIVFAVLLLGVSFIDPIAGISGALAVITSNIFAQILGFNKKNIISGLYGFNSLLIGLGLGSYFQFSAQFLALLLIASVMTLLFTIFLEGIIGKYGLPFLTLSFLLAFWFITLATRQYSGLQLSERGIFMYNQLYFEGNNQLVVLYQWFSDTGLPLCWQVYFKSLSAIFFQYHLFAGLLIAAGLIYYSRIAFLLSLLGYFSAYYFYQFIGAGFDELNYAYIGFNYILTAIAIGGFFVVSSRTSFLWVVLLTPVTSILISSSSVVLSSLQLSTLSLPFNMVVLIFLYSLKFRENLKGKMELVHVQEFSPERNLYSRINYKNRFGLNNQFPISLPFIGQWTVSQAHSGAHTHQEKWRHAWDFVILGADGKQFTGEGLQTRDYYCYGKPIVAPANGYVIEILDNIEDNKIGEMNLTNNWGNSIVIKHAENIYTQISHLQKQSFKVAIGSYVKQGEILGYCGNSGRSPFPHIHFQVQETPYIGSGTLNYELSEYVLHTNESTSLVTNGIPKENELISNLSPNTCLLKSLSFIPGQIITLEIEENESSKTEIVWEVKTDLYNYTYFYCSQTNSKAWFYNNGRQFYFTWFEGSRQSLLFDFYRGLYRMATVFYKGLTVSDEFPLNVLNHKPIKIVQDFISPFWIFLNYSFSLRYIIMKNEIDEDEIEIESEIYFQSWKKSKKELNSKLFFANNRLEKMVFKKKGKTLIVVVKKENPIG